MKIIKVITLFVLLSTVLFSCKKNDKPEPTPEVHQTIAKDLVDVIAEKGVTDVQICYDSYWEDASSQFSFPGDNFIKVKNVAYNLNLLKYYYTSSYSNGSRNVVVLRLVFPKP